jgi:mercuric ion binding protein
MKNYRMTIAAATLLGLAGTSMGTTATTVAAAPSAAVQTRTFAIAKMTCPTCPISVKTAMSRVAGVKQVMIDFNAKTATVTYDASIATPAKIAAASADIGYPAALRGS